MAETVKIDGAWVPDLPAGSRATVRFGKWERKQLRRKKLIPVSEWAARYRVVPSDSSVPGRWRNSTTPYLAGIMDAAFFPSVKEVVVCAPPQTGKTDFACNCIASAADQKPGNVLIVYPDENTARDMSKDRVRPMFEDSPRLRRLLTGAADDLSSIRLNLRNMKIFLAWANSAARLGARPLPYVLLDEEDKYPPTVGKKEAAPVDLARKRTRTFGHMKKIIRASTPTTENGPIWRALNDECEAIFYYWARCPVCARLQQMVFENIKWVDGGNADPRALKANPASAWYVCEHCDAEWNNATRDRAVAAGKWLEKQSGIGLETYLQSRRPAVIGFHYKAWISRFVAMSEAAAAFLWAQKDKTKLKDFQNDYNAEPWRVYEVERQEETILSLRDDRPRGQVPGGNVVAALTAGIDTQDNGFYYEIRAWTWGAGELLQNSWGIREGFVLTFDELIRVLFDDEYKDVDGNVYVVRLCIQDALGHRTAEVYDFCRRHRGRIIAGFGRDRLAAPFNWSNQEYYPGSKRPIPGGLKTVNINTKYFKDKLSGLLEISPGDPSAWAYHSELTPAYAQQMTAEYINERGVWDCPPHKANHLWDCSVYNLVAHEILGIKFWKKPAPDRSKPKSKKTAADGRW